MTTRADRRTRHRAGRSGRRSEFGGYAAVAWPRLLRTAHLLTGDPAEADALTRTTLSDAYAHWRRIPGNDTDFYVRRLLVRHHLGRHVGRTLGRTLGRRVGRRPHRTGPAPQAPLARALAALPARQRVVLVLRLGEDLGRLEIAEMLGWSVGAVKSYERRGLKALGAA
ncbi:sigma factor-like helix-turn-helix DNA-binding protein [Streptomyces sp. NPDC101165]|uniref:sigma factor-like helix-turn-helix DNA-binding protein n=1 Tax=Streptomyces sp. NPDC101165 TaxID=3366119 RepID=UPI0037FDEF8C